MISVIFFCRLLNHGYIYNIEFAILTILRAWFSGINYTAGAKAVRSELAWHV